MTITQKDFSTHLTLPLPINTSVAIADVVTDDGEHLTLTLGLDAKAVDSFKQHSCNLDDAELHRFTSDYKRICENGYEAWYSKERYPYGLVNTAGELAALIWFGPKAPPALTPPLSDGANWQTFAIRTYPPYRGKRLAFPFSEAVFTVHAQIFPNVPIWLDTDLENAGAIGLYKKLGFVEVGETEGRLVMTRT